MKSLIIGVSSNMPEGFSLLAELLDSEYNREAKPISCADLTDIGAVIITASDIESGLHTEISETGYGIPIFLLSDNEPVNPECYAWITGVIDLERQSATYYARQINEAATKYEERLLPPFFKSMAAYVDMGNSQYDCPDTVAASFSANTQQESSSTISTGKTCSVVTSVMLTLPLAIC